jgi:protein-ribulosamine 3-kinase
LIMSDADIVRVLKTAFGKPIAITTRRRVGGGCIHHAERITTTIGDIFIKYNARHQDENFQAEADGLKTLADTKTLRVPTCIAISHSDHEACLILEWIDSKPKRADFWEQFGETLAHLHQHTNLHFGYKRDNFIGALPQRNKAHATWCDFFREERLMPMLRLALQERVLSPDEVRRVERLFPKLEALIPNESPALLHGDLWSGNFLIDERGLPVVIDPAVYFGHREAELAFMHLFGGFDKRLFEAYHRVFPLQADWQERMEVFNLYPLLVHVNLFGRSYWRQIETTLKKFGV